LPLEIQPDHRYAKKFPLFVSIVYYLSEQGSYHFFVPCESFAKLLDCSPDTISRFRQHAVNYGFIHVIAEHEREARKATVFAFDASRIDHETQKELPVVEGEKKKPSSTSNSKHHGKKSRSGVSSEHTREQSPCKEVRASLRAGGEQQEQQSRRDYEYRSAGYRRACGPIPVQSGKSKAHGTRRRNTGLQGGKDMAGSTRGHCLRT
jgi:hypothetical protein